MTQSTNEAVIRNAYEAYAEGDLARMLEFVDPGLEWTYLDPAVEDPQPQICHGRYELENALQGMLDSGLRSFLEEVRGQGDRIMVLVRTPGIDRYRAYKADDRNYNVLTVRDDQIVAIRNCRDREEALAVGGIEQR
jgi:ketosteroid isomerase-like protein